MTPDQIETLRHIERLYGPIETRGKRIETQGPGEVVHARSEREGPFYVEPNGDYTWGDPPKADDA